MLQISGNIDKVTSNIESESSECGRATYFSFKKLGRKDISAFFLTWKVWGEKRRRQVLNVKDLSSQPALGVSVSVKVKESDLVWTSLTSLLGRAGRKAEREAATVTFLLTEMWPFKAAAWLPQLQHTVGLTVRMLKTNRSNWSQFIRVLTIKGKRNVFGNKIFSIWSKV